IYAPIHGPPYTPQSPSFVTIAHERWINHTCDDAMNSKFPPALILLTFTAAVFTSALLLFGVQPMFTRMVLPNLGGSPSVWSVAMVFFQTMLLAGYAYAHYLMKAKRSVVVVSIHLVLIILAGLTLPLSVARGWGEPPAQWTALWLVGLFVVSIG